MRGERKTQWCGQGRAGGFTLFETLIVLAIGVAVIGGIMFVMQANERAERRDSATVTQALELANISKAARQWADTEGEAWDDGSRHEVSIDDLVDRGLLPDDFAARDADPLVQGVTPAGQRYTIVSVKNGPSGSLYHDPNVAEGKIRTVIWDAGDPVAGRLERIGVQNVVGAILAWKEAVALDTSREHRIPAGVLAAGSGEVRGVGRSFTKDVIDWIENEVTQPAAVALVGFPDLEGDDGGGGGPTGPVAASCEEIQWLEEGLGCPDGPNSTSCWGYEEPQCPTGFEEVGAHHICSTAGQLRSVSTPAGLLVMGQEQYAQSTPNALVQAYQCDPNNPANCQTVYIPCGGQSVSYSTGYATLAGSRIWSAECRYTEASTQLTYSGFTPSCTPAPGLTRTYPTFPLNVGEARSKLCCRRPASR